MIDISGCFEILCSAFRYQAYKDGVLHEDFFRQSARSEARVARS